MNFTGEESPSSLLNEDFEACNWYVQTQDVSEDQAYSQYQVPSICTYPYLEYLHVQTQDISEDCYTLQGSFPKFPFKM